MKDVKLLAILVGVITDVGSTQVILVKFLIIELLTNHAFRSELRASMEDRELALIVPEMILGGLGSFIGGFICGRLAKVAEIKNTILMGIASTSTGMLMVKSITPSFFVVGTIVTMGAATMGGYLSLLLAGEERATPSRPVV